MPFSKYILSEDTIVGYALNELLNIEFEMLNSEGIVLGILNNRDN